MIGSKKTFGASVTMLAAVALIGKLIGAVYRIPLTNILGGEGIGIYQLAFPIYALLLVLSGSSIPTCMARLIAECESVCDKENRNNIFLSALFIMAVTGLIGALVMAGLAVPISYIQGAPQLKYGYFILAPSVFFIAISGALRGWYQGKSDMRPYSYMQLVEQLSKLILGVGLAWWLSRYGMIYAVMGAFAAVAFSELVSMLTMVAMYLRDADRPRKASKIDTKSLKLVIKTAIPIVFNGLVIPVVTFIESIIIVRLITLSGRTDTLAVADYGMMTGVVNTLINMPVVLAIALSVAVVPTVARYRAARDINAVKTKADMGVRLAMLIGIPCFIVMSIMPSKIISTLYPSINAESASIAVTLLALGGIQVLLLSVQQIYASVLQGLGQQTRVMRVTAIGGATKLILDVALVPFIGIIGAVVSAVVSYGFIAIVNTLQYKHVLGRGDNAVRSVAKLFLSGVAMAVAVFCAGFIPNKYISLSVGIACGILVYSIALYLLNAFTSEELSGVPLINKLVNLRTKRH